MWPTQWNHDKFDRKGFDIAFKHSCTINFFFAHHFIWDEFMHQISPHQTENSKFTQFSCYAIAFLIRFFSFYFQEISRQTTDMNDSKFSLDLDCVGHETCIALQMSMCPNKWKKYWHLLIFQTFFLPYHTDTVATSLVAYSAGCLKH